MTLAFSTKWPKHMGGESNYFPEKIWKGFHDEQYNLESFEDYMFKEYAFRNIVDRKAKIHTLRADLKNRWKEGNKIHPVINNRTPQRFQFAPTIKCTGVQKIQIEHKRECVKVFIDGVWFGNVFHNGIGNVYAYTNCVKRLAINDGFDSVEQFLHWFNEDFTGKIIHWTDLRY